MNLPALSDSELLPHGDCLDWEPGLLWTTATADGLIAAAYFSIPLALSWFAQQQKNLHFHALFWMFSLFILACGMTHLLAIANIWQPWYWLSAGVKTFTAVISVATAVVLWLALPAVRQFLDQRTELQHALEARNRELGSALARARQLEVEARQSEQRFRLTLANAPIGLATVSLDGRFTSVNQALCDMLGYTEAELTGLTFQAITHPADLQADLELVDDLLRGRRDSYRMEKRYITKPGKELLIQLDVALMVDDNGDPQHFISQIQDITERKNHELILRDGEQRLRTLLANLPTAVVVHRADTEIEYANPRAAELLGLSTDSLAGRTAVDPAWRFLREDGELMSVEDFPISQVLASGRPLKDFVMAVLKPHTTTPIWVHVNAFPARDDHGFIDRVIVSFIDISERRRLEEELRHQAQTDALTGLYNRRQFLRLANAELARARRHQRPLAALLLDVDSFKQLNDRYGHDTGDQVLRALGDTCRQLVRQNDIPCRLGGEEFALLLPETDHEQALQAASRLHEAIRAQRLPLPGGETLRWTASIGVALREQDDEDVAALLKRADRAMYDAKKAGRDCIRLAS